jgi:hypothetical protein
MPHGKSRVDLSGHEPGKLPAAPDTGQMTTRFSTLIRDTLFTETRTTSGIAPRTRGFPDAI